MFHFQDAMGNGQCRIIGISKKWKFSVLPGEAADLLLVYNHVFDTDKQTCLYF